MAVPVWPQPWGIKYWTVAAIRCRAVGGSLASGVKIALGAHLETPVTIFTDVMNPLLGPTGAAYVYARQKGATDADVGVLEAALKNFADLVEPAVGAAQCRDRNGAGAAGGLGFALMSLCKGRPRSGAEAVAELVGLNEVVVGAGVVITGEGALDRQTLWGKAPAYVARRARRSGARVFAIAGTVEPAADTPFDGILDLGPDGLQRPTELLRERAMDLALMLDR